MYGNTAASLHFCEIHKPPEIIYLENLKGLTPLLLAKTYPNMKIHLFSAKKNYFAHPNIKIYNRLPEEADFQKLKGLPLINTLCYAPQLPSSYAYKTYPFLGVAESNRYIEFFKPTNSISLYHMPPTETYLKIMQGIFWVCPFYIISNSNYIFLYQSEFSSVHQIINTESINERVYFYKYFIKNRSWDGVDHDTFLCRPYWKPDIEKLLGPLPKSNNPHIILEAAESDIKQYAANNIIENTYVALLWPIYFKPLYTGSFFGDILVYVFPKFVLKHKNQYLFVNDALTDALKKFCPFIIQKGFNYKKIDHPTIFADSLAAAEKKYKILNLMDTSLISACAQLAKQILKNPPSIKVNTDLAAAVFQQAFPAAKVGIYGVIDYSL